MKRRFFLKGAGAVVVLVAGGVVWRARDEGAFSAGKGPGFEPWNDWEKDSSGPMGLVRAAILAASPHNTQPWLFKISSDAIEVYLAPARNVGPLDPYLREEHIGVGCALENLMAAAAAEGYRATVTMFPGELEGTSGGDAPRLLARVDLAAGERQKSELYDAIPLRHTNRSAYFPARALPAEFVEELRKAASDEPMVMLYLFEAESDRKKIVEISVAANKEIYADPAVVRGTNQWTRVTWEGVKKYRDGLTIDAFGLSPVGTAVAKTVPLRVLEWAASRGEANGYSKLMLSAPLIGILGVRDRYGREDCLRAGRVWQRAHLLATARGVAGRPCNEAVEMIDYERAHGRQPLRAELLSGVLGGSGWQPMFIFYMGYPTFKAGESPRRPVEDALLQG